MRHAEAADFRRRLRVQERQWVTRLSRFAVEEVPSLGSAEIPFFSPLTVLSGPNGVGKTTLLRALWGALDPESASSILRKDRRLTAGRATVAAIVGGEEHEFRTEFPPSESSENQMAGVPVLHIDSALETPTHQAAFSEFESVDDLTNGIAAREMKPEELAEASYIVGRNYRDIKLFEVEFSGDIVAPFFEVSYGNDRYDTRTMGSGEVAALYIWWKLNRAVENSIILVEEPEAYLSHAAQRNLANYLISIVVKKKLCAVVSSHSAPLITSVPKESIKFITRGQDGMEVVSEPIPPLALKSVGIDPPIAAIVFVEDTIGHLTLKSVLEKMDVSLARRIQIDSRGGDGEITRALRITKTFHGSIKFVGAFDGDMAGKLPKDVMECSVLLPGNQPIEQQFRELASTEFDKLVSATAVENLRVILNALEGEDHHDWFTLLANECGTTHEQLFSIFFAIWMEKEANREDVQRTYESLLALIFPE